MTKLTPSRLRIIRAIEAIQDRGDDPHLSVIAKACKVSEQYVHKVIKDAIKRGHIFVKENKKIYIINNLD